MNKQVIYIDMDDTIADFCGHPVFGGVHPPDVSHMYTPGFFFELKPIKGAHRAVRALLRAGYDVHILSQPVAESAHSYSEKVQWISVHFPELIGKINFTQDKGLFVGMYLIDDNPVKWKMKFEDNGGLFIHFDYFSNHEEQWKKIVDSLVSKGK